MYIDTHAHFDICKKSAGFIEEDLISEMYNEKVTAAVQVCTESSDFKWCRDFAYRHDNIYYTLGIHPSSDFKEEDISLLEENIVNEVKKDSAKKLFAIGETGLDYYWMHYPKKKQQEIFENQLFLAKKYDLPVVVHSRDAMEDTIAVLKNNQIEKAIIHCFSGRKDDARQLLSLGYFISFTGNVTFKKAIDIQEAAVYVPGDRILFETDCPFLAPVPRRGGKNRPAYVR